ncbi:MAG: hypothetical protein IT167_28730 [Bryobacterales bacterium]|nr:hypothetical protein [Bryobacterales bacterium]
MTGDTIRFDGGRYRIGANQVKAGMRKATVRVEWRLDDSIAVRYQENYLQVERCPESAKPCAANFDLKKSMPVWKAAQGSGHRSGE